MVHFGRAKFGCEYRTAIFWNAHAATTVNYSILTFNQNNGFFFTVTRYVARHSTKYIINVEAQFKNILFVVRVVLWRHRYIKFVYCTWKKSTSPFRSKMRQYF